MSDDQIRLAMASSFVDYIIPFHTNLSKEILMKKNIDHWKNYKNFQVDKDKATGRNATNINIYTDVLDAARAEGKPITNRKEFQEKFFEVAKERNLIPRFAQFINKNKKGEYVYTPGYEKFLIDFKLFDKRGNIVEQQVVRPVFDDKYNTKLMNDFAAGVGYTEISDELYSNVVEKLNANSKGGEVQYSSKINPSKEKLVAIRNVDKGNLGSMLGLEGLPSPSIAITKDDIGHVAFGDVSFVFGKDTIDPKANRKNLVFDADAWTPLYPGIEYEYDKKLIRDVYDKIQALKSDGKSPNDYAVKANAVLNRS